MGLFRCTMHPVVTLGRPGPVGRLDGERVPEILFHWYEGGLMAWNSLRSCCDMLEALRACARYFRALLRTLRD